jgi:hypothetical protein
MIFRMKMSRMLTVFLAGYPGLICGSVSFVQANSAAPLASAQRRAVTVPFVGCASDGQAGPQTAPTGQAKTVAIAAKAAQRLAYYKAQYSAGVLAPRGWHCFSTYGSDGANLFVSPSPIDTTNIFSADWKGITGDGIEVSVSSGGTSGRFEVAKVVARVFPAYKAFAQSVVAEGLEPASDFPFGPFPKDKLTYRSQSMVEFETPANTQGLGTMSRLEANASPIEGVAMISGPDTDLTQLSARLSGANRDLAPAIVKQAESDAAAAATQ